MTAREGRRIENDRKDGHARSPHWRALRRKVVKEHGKHCDICSSRRRIEVHHIIPFHEAPRLELYRPNLMVLCFWCHLNFGHLRSWRYKFDPLLRQTAETWRRRFEMARMPQELLEAIRGGQELCTAGI